MRNSTPFLQSVDRAYKNRVHLLICQAYSNFSDLSKCSSDQVPYNLACVANIPIKRLSDFRTGQDVPTSVEFLKILDACRVRVNYSCPEPKTPVNYVPSSLIPSV